MTTVSLDDEPVSEEAGHLTPEGEHELRLGQTEQEGLGVDSEQSSELAYQTARKSWLRAAKHAFFENLSSNSTARQECHRDSVQHLAGGARSLGGGRLAQIEFAV